MNDQVIDAISRANPYPAELPPPPIEPVLDRIRSDVARRPDVRRRTGRPGAGSVVLLLSSAVTVAIAAVALVALRHGGAAGTAGTAADHRGGPAASLMRGCRSDVRDRVLPAWARAGFSEARPRMPYVLGRSGRIVAILWVTLDSPPSSRHSNKILWVSRSPDLTDAPLEISAQRMVAGTTRRLGPPVERSVGGGPGPSIINLPAPGCWRTTLRWGRSTDQLDLAYVRP